MTHRYRKNTRIFQFISNNIIYQYHFLIITKNTIYRKVLSIFLYITQKSIKSDLKTMLYNKTPKPSLTYPTKPYFE